MSRSRRIYVVDDDPEVIQGLEKNLSEAGFEVRTARDGTGLLGVLKTTTSGTSPSPKMTVAFES